MKRTIATITSIVAATALNTSCTQPVEAIPYAPPSTSTAATSATEEPRASEEERASQEPRVTEELEASFTDAELSHVAGAVNGFFEGSAPAGAEVTLSRADYEYGFRLLASDVVLNDPPAAPADPMLLVRVHGPFDHVIPFSRAYQARNPDATPEPRVAEGAFLLVDPDDGSILQQAAIMDSSDAASRDSSQNSSTLRFPDVDPSVEESVTHTDIDVLSTHQP